MNTVVKDYLKIKSRPKANPESIVIIGSARFTVLTPRIIRMEYDYKKKFEDRASFTILNRNFPKPDFKTYISNDKLIVETEYLILEYLDNGDGFTRQTLKIKLKETGVVWRFSEIDYSNLKGTARTLDHVDGKCRLSDGLISRKGYSVIDDSGTVVFGEEGWLETRIDAESLIKSELPIDMYFLGFGHDYKDCIKEFYMISGRMEMFPKWVLGNWWSRYYAYSQDELISLMEEFQQREIPLEVCIVDMDWHVVENQYTDGWTGYTWNKRLFPEPEKFLKRLHELGLKTALNLHPADGIHPHEEIYSEVAKFMGIDPKTEIPVKFDISDKNFFEAYFEIVHHPFEEKGVDFWWIDWQQGTKSKVFGLDPLVWLNHYHYIDMKRDNRKRPFIFSRYAGLGSHRYPIGFSGDTYITWNSLSFQPYFTATASNVAFGWWSHDIGGHMSGIEEPELYLRWVQLGVVSPILRLHCTCNPYNDRRPWAFGDEVYECVKQAMQLRHSLIPYLYTMLRRNYEEGMPPILPMYYEFPESEHAYSVKNQFYFGTELIAAPFVQPIDPEVCFARQPVWFPDGDWFSFFTGEYYQGGCVRTIYGEKSDIPIFAKAGAIVPLGPEKKYKNLCPEKFDIYIFPGADNIFSLYEDDGISNEYENGKYCYTIFENKFIDNEIEFIINKVKGEYSFLPTERKFNLHFRGIEAPNDIEAYIDGTSFSVETFYDVERATLSVVLPKIKYNQSVRVKLKKNNSSIMCTRDRTYENCKKLLRKIKIESYTKLDIDNDFEKIKNNPKVFFKYSNKMTANQSRAILEVIFGKEITCLIEKGKE